MAVIIDRTRNPSGRSIPNRVKLSRRLKARIKEHLDDVVGQQSIKGDIKTQKIPISRRDNRINEPTFRPDPRAGGTYRRVLPGNKEYEKGDTIPKPKVASGEGGGKDAADSGESEDDFLFLLTEDEFLDLLFEDMELPDLVKTDLADMAALKQHHAGISSVGTPPNINLRRTMQQSKGRRIALNRPSEEELQALRAEIDKLEQDPDPHEEKLAELREEYERLEHRRKTVPYLDPHDIRFNTHEQRPEPQTRAVMFCLMDVSGSMAEHEKSLAKRFFLLLNIFLKCKYDTVDTVFIRHTHSAKEVDEDTFFHSTESGGTMVSTALSLTYDIIKERYANGEWNIYVAEASDSDNVEQDNAKCILLLKDMLMPLLQFFFYIEVLTEREGELIKNNESAGKSLWRTYLQVREAVPNFTMKRVSKPGDIYQVFRSLFAKRRTQ